ncbi:RNA-guided endonuclease InsQ/TnpB family protein [Coleofasciculus sp. G3-WIS-01]|uniref:RNA-guided endonuclease InsQ/TnpB family protein n=1 Tax=Coleofasciculus sp. G3-WIS-01 TaxID=3069528 RepID=UPI00406451AB
MFALVYEFKLKPTSTQIATFEEWLEQCRRIYNYALCERKHWVNSRKCPVNACSIKSEYIIPADTPAPTYNSQAVALTQAKKNIPALKQVHSQVLQQTLRRLQLAFEGMWENGRGFPRYKKAGRMRSFVFPSMGKEPIQGNQVKLPKIGLVKFKQSRPIPDDAIIKQARIVRRASGWYVQLTLRWEVDVPFGKLRASPQISPTGTSLGIDVGLMHFAAVSNGRTFPNPRPFKRMESKLKSLQKKVSNKRLGSNNRAKAQAKVSRLHERIANTRKNYHWELAHKLCDWADMIFAEQLNLKGLARGMLAKSCLDAGWGQFLSILSQCCLKRGVYFQKVPAAGTSQTCPKCLKETGKKKLSRRVHKCQHCGYECDRDVAAAQVVEIRGLLTLSEVERQAVGHTVGKLSEGKGHILEDVKLCLPMKKESPALF